ncbi:hypothetical protein AVEN_132723-1 [Araneus ventricosus]|uniref:Uncharacterized protein n=1 Tax=Araneus ventricosus TaxID=182803 RepID=A0A4Y2TM71_ARAVE|nr:hypothetical protein AVEN_132723-1 [Araneus ventricosus]
MRIKCAALPIYCHNPPAFCRCKDIVILNVTRHGQFLLPGNFDSRENLKFITSALPFQAIMGSIKLHNLRASWDDVDNIKYKAIMETQGLRSSVELRLQQAIHLRGNLCLQADWKRKEGTPYNFEPCSDDENNTSSKERFLPSLTKIIM